MTDLIRATFPLTPKGIIDHLKLRRPIYRETAAFGHFGRNRENFSWEKTDKASALKHAAAEGPPRSRIKKPPLGGCTAGKRVRRLENACLQKSLHVRVWVLFARGDRRRTGLLRHARALAGGRGGCRSNGGNRLVRPQSHESA